MTNTERRAYAACVAVCVIWGTTYLGIRITLETIPPALMGGIRYTLAGLLLGAVLIARGERAPSLRAWGPLATMGFLLIGLGNGGVVWAQQWVPSGMTAIIVGASPFWMIAVEAALPGGERLTWRTAAGLTLGFVGIVLLVWPDLQTPSSAGFGRGVVTLQIACIGWSLGSAYSRRHGGHGNVLVAAAAQMLTGGLFMLAFGTLRGEWNSLAFAPRSTAALIYLIVVGAIGGFAAYAYALKHLPVSLVSLYAYINPIIAVALGILILDEPFTGRIAIAAGIVFAGVAVVRRGHTARPTHESVSNAQPSARKQAAA
jgi:drug/metabolite transporter (DMT)-like permease